MEDQGSKFHKTKSDCENSESKENQQPNIKKPPKQVKKLDLTGLGIITKQENKVIIINDFLKLNIF